MDNKIKKRKELRNKLFSKFFQNKEGISASTLNNKVKFIIEKYDELNKLLAKEDEHFALFDNVGYIKKVMLEHKEYLVLRTSSFKFIIIDIDNKKTLDTDEVNKIFNNEFFKQNIDEHGLSDLYEFLSTGYINEILKIYEKNESLFNLPTHIIYEVNINDANATLIININCENCVLMFNTPDQFLYEQIFLGKDLKPSGMSSPTLDQNKALGIANKVKDIIIPFNVIPSELLLIINEYELVNTIKSLKYKRLDDVKQEVYEKYGKSLLDLTEAEVDTLSHKAFKEYRQLSRCLFWEIGKYAECMVTEVETLRNVYDKLKEFKEYYERTGKKVKAKKKK